MARNVPPGKRTRPECMLMVPPAVNAPQAMALYRVELADTDTNWKCSFPAGIVLALAAVALVPATAAARESVQAAAPKNLRMVPPVFIAAYCGGHVSTGFRSPS